MVHGDDHRPGSAVPQRTVRDELGLQETTRWDRLASDAMFGQVRVVFLGWEIQHHEESGKAAGGRAAVDARPGACQDITKRRPNGCPDPSSGTIRACRSMKPLGCKPTVGMPIGFRSSVNTSAGRTRPTTGCAALATCVCGGTSIQAASDWLRFTHTCRLGAATG